MIPIIRHINIILRIDAQPTGSPEFCLGPFPIGISFRTTRHGRHHPLRRNFTDPRTIDDIDIPLAVRHQVTRLTEFSDAGTTIDNLIYTRSG